MAYIYVASETHVIDLMHMQRVFGQEFDVECYEGWNVRLVNARCTLLRTNKASSCREGQ